MSWRHRGHAPHDPAPLRAGGREPFVHRPMTREQAYAICIACGRRTAGLVPIEPKLTPDGESYDARVPMQWIEQLLEDLRPPASPDR